MAAPRGQRGAAALIVTMLLFFAMVLAAVFTNRSLVVEQRTSANQYRSTQAFEAADAGLEWALAQLNSNGAIGDDCLASATAGATPFRARYLHVDTVPASFAPVTWSNAGTPTALQPTCVRGGSGWSCSCPTAGHPVLAAPSANDPAPAFTLSFQPGARPGSVRVVSTGCTRLAGACVPGGATTADATARVQIELALLPGLRTAPSATLTARGGVTADVQPIGLHNPDPSTGIAVLAGGAIATGRARLTAPAGSPPSTSLVGNDVALAALTPDRFFASYFGLDKAAWRDQPAVTTVDCHSPCAAALQAAIAAAPGNAMLWVEGDLALAGPMTLGTVRAPVLIVVNGTVQLDGAVVVNGLLYSGTLNWSNTSGGGAVLRGALITEDSYQGNGAPDLFYDPQVLAALRGTSGTFARVSGSWRDF